MERLEQAEGEIKKKAVKLAKKCEPKLDEDNDNSM